MITKIILSCFAAVIIAVVVFCVVVATRPAEFKIERSAMIEAAPERVFSQVDDFHNWEAWSPWSKLDPAMKTSYGGAASGVGSIYSWTGNDEAGEGTMTITGSHPFDHITIDIDFRRPFAAKSISDFSFKPEGGKTVVTWTMTGNNNFAAKAFGLFVNTDKLVGGDFEKGLAQMKAVAESGSNPVN
jgi:Polyketide cyclase / dehydrase and lipid transport